LTEPNVEDEAWRRELAKRIAEWSRGEPASRYEWDLVFCQMLKTGALPERWTRLLLRAGAHDHHYLPYSGKPDPAMTEDELRELAGMDAGCIPIGLVARHANTPPELLAELAAHAQSLDICGEVLMLLAQNPRTPVPVLQDFACRDDEPLVQMMARHTLARSK
jgi:hypothetical protein